MSMENAILEHAGALKELAAAIRSVGAGASPLAFAADLGDALLRDKAAELAAATKQRAAAAHEALKKDTDEVKKPTPAVGTATAAATSTATPTLGPAGASGDPDANVVKAVSAEIEKKGTVAADLDYAKDIRPVLLAAIKKGKRAEIEAHLAEAGVAKADQLKPEQLPAILELATALAA